MTVQAALSHTKSESKIRFLAQNLRLWTYDFWLFALLIHYSPR